MDPGFFAGIQPLLWRRIVTDSRIPPVFLRGPWNDWPLKRIFAGITVLVLVFFTVILGLGIRQYLLYNQCLQAVNASDRLLFHFTTIKDHLNESLILANKVDLRALTNELQTLEKEVADLKNNVLVPDGLSTMLPSRGDLLGLEVQLRSIQEDPQKKGQETVTLVRALSRTNAGLQQFRFGLSDHTQRILLGLHKIIAGALGLIVVLSCTLLFLFNRSLSAPILALCRMPGAGQTSKPCTVNTLMNQITRLESLAQQPPTQVDREPAGPEALVRQAHCFRHSVLGLMHAEFGSELTNSLNGILNYTQSLIDVEGEAKGDQLRAGILPRLMQEEKKTAELVSTWQKVGQWQPSRPSSIALDRLFSQLKQMLEKGLRAESITLVFPDRVTAEALVPAGDLWLTLLTLIDQGRRALNKEPASHTTPKQIRITLAASANKNQPLSLQLENTSGTWLQGDQLLWPDRPFCAQLLQMHQGSLSEQAMENQIQLILTVPCRNMGL